MPLIGRGKQYYRMQEKDKKKSTMNIKVSWNK